MLFSPLVFFMAAVFIAPSSVLTESMAQRSSLPSSACVWTLPSLRYFYPSQLVAERWPRWYFSHLGLSARLCSLHGQHPLAVEMVPGRFPTGRHRVCYPPRLDLIPCPCELSSCVSPPAPSLTFVGECVWKGPPETTPAFECIADPPLSLLIQLPSLGQWSLSYRDAIFTVRLGCSTRPGYPSFPVLSFVADAEMLQSCAVLLSGGCWPRRGSSCL